MTARARRWKLGPQSFDRLLSLLDADREVAGEKYELLRSRLVRIFEWRGCRAPDTLADETFDRVSRRLEQGEQIRAADPSVYFYGVARNVLKEYWTDHQRQTKAHVSESDSRERAVSMPEVELREARLDCLDRCLARMPGDGRALIERYYRSDSGQKIVDRVALAETLGVSAGTLRIRAHRIRKILEACVNECMRSQER